MRIATLTIILRTHNCSNSVAKSYWITTPTIAPQHYQSQNRYRMSSNLKWYTQHVRHAHTHTHCKLCSNATKLMYFRFTLKTTKTNLTTSSLFHWTTCAWNCMQWQFCESRAANRAKSQAIRKIWNCEHRKTSCNAVMPLQLHCDTCAPAFAMRLKSRTVLRRQMQIA